jgi:hypothetical protein
MDTCEETGNKDHDKSKKAEHQRTPEIDEPYRTVESQDKDDNDEALKTRNHHTGPRPVKHVF